MHPQTGFGRPGWLRCEQFGAGMITGWGALHVDTAHWGMNTEYTGPVEVWGSAEFPTHGLWNVHGKFLTHALYAKRRNDGHQRRFPQWHQVLPVRGVDLRHQGIRGDVERPGETGAQDGTSHGERSEDSRQRDRIGRGPLI